MLTVKRLAATLHISKDKLQKGMLHIAKHHWREAALDYVRNKEGQYSMTHIYEFNSREEWLEVATIIEEADIFTKEPNGQLKVFLSPNCFVGEWPALLQKLGVVSFHEQVFKRVLDKHVSSAPQDWPSLGNEFKAVDSHVDLQVDQNKLGAGSEVYDFNAQTASYNNTDSAATSKVHAKGDDRGLAGLFDANVQSASFFNADSTDYLRSYGNNIAELDTNRSITEATAQSALDELMTMPLAEFKECEPQAVPHLGTISTASMIFHSDCNNIDTNHFNVEATNQPPADKWRTMSLRQWSGNVKYLTGENCKASTSSPGYLNASLKIALSLAEQLNLQKNDNLSHSLLNGAGSDWTEWTVVRLKDDYSEELSGYLNIDSAEIVSPKTAMKQPAAVYRIGSSHSQQIYYLGLVFYFLFSGGENPPPALLQILASFDGAFISLSTMTLVEPNEVETQTTTRLSNKRHQGPSSSKEKMGICQLSCEYLRLIGVASPLCEMLFHMLDCIYGDLAHKDCFGNISEVVDDLQLLTDKPSMFFQALDANMCSLELQLEALAIPRELEYNTLRACYHCCVAGSCQSGKSRLATMIGDNIKGEVGLFLSAKFDQMRQSLPFPALAAVFDQYCDAILDQKESDWAKPAVEKLQKVLGSDASVLALIIPELGKILNLDCHSAASIIGTNGNNAIQKLNHLLCQFVETAVTTSEVSITILLDDIQWADDASIAVIKYILKQVNQRFFFLCCCRDDEMPSNHIFWKMLDEIQSDGIQPITVQLHPMGEETQNRAMSELLCLLPRAVRPLSSIVYSRTHGNPYFFCQIMLSLYHEGSIYFDLGRGRWMWDEDKILSQKLPDSIALFLTHQICKLPLSVQSATHTLAMFGVSARVSYLKVIEDRTGLQLIELLHQAVSERLVIYQNDAFRFSHDRIQEACYGIICGHLRQLNHLFYGRCLVQQAISTDDDTMFFSAMNQINVAGPSAVSSADESFVIAEHNLTAGKKAMQLSAFSLAYSFFDKGITFLNKDHWRHSEQRYRFSLKIYEFACQSALATGNIRSLNALLEEVLKNAKCLEDKLNAHYFRISALVNSSNILEAIEMGLGVTSKLGEHISSNPSQGDVDKNIQRTKSILHGMSDDDILSHQIMVREKNIMLMKILARLQASAFLAKPALHSILVLRMVQISLKDG